MTEEMAQLLLAGITAIALAAWVAGVQFLLRSKRKPPTDDESQAVQSESELPANWVHTSAEVAGEPGTLANHSLARIMASGTTSVWP